MVVNSLAVFVGGKPFERPTHSFPEWNSCLKLRNKWFDFGIVEYYAPAFVAQQMDAAIAQGYAELDHTTIMLIEEQLANIKNL